MHTASNCILSPSSHFLVSNPSQKSDAPDSKLLLQSKIQQKSSSSSPFDLLFALLKEKGLIDAQGALINFENFSLPPLGIPQIERVSRLLNTPFTILGNDESFSFDIKLGELLQFLESKKSITKISSIEIVGGTVFWVLGVDYAKALLEKVGVHEIDKVVPLEMLNECFREPPDVDIRINIPVATSFLMKQFRDELIKFLAQKLPADTSEKEKRIYDKCFLKFKPVNDGSNSFFIAAFGNRNTKVIDLLFVKSLKRNHLFIHDAIRLNILPLLKKSNCPDGFLTVVPEGNFQRGMGSIIHRVCKILNGIDIENIDLSGTLLLISYYTKGWHALSPEFERIMSQKAVRALSCSDVNSGEIQELKKSIQNHFPNDPIAISSVLYNGLQLLFNYGCKKQIRTILDGFAPMFELNVGALNPRSTPITSLILMQINKKAEFEEISSLLQIQSFIKLCSDNQIRNLSCDAVYLIKNGSHNAIQVRYSSSGHSYALQLPYDPANAMKAFSQACHHSKDKDSILDIYKFVSQLIFPKTLTYECKTNLTDSLEHKDTLKSVQDEAHIWLEKKEPFLRNMGFSLILEYVKNCPDANSLLLLGSKLPVVLLSEPIPHRREYLLKTFISAFQASNLGHHLPPLWQSLDALTAKLQQETLVEDEFYRLFCLAFSKIEHPSFAALVISYWRDFKTKTSSDGYITFSLSLIFEGFFPSNQAFALRIFSDLLTLPAENYAVLWPAFNKLCDYIKTSPDNKEDAQSVSKLADFGKFFLKNLNPSPHSLPVISMENISWLINRLCESSFNESFEILRLATNRKALGLAKSSISDLWLDCARAALIKLGVSKAFSVCTEIPSKIKNSSMLEQNKWTNFELELLRKLQSQKSSDPVEEQIYDYLCASKVQENHRQSLNTLVCKKFDQFLEKFDFKSLQERLCSQWSRVLTSSQKIYYHQKILQKQLSPKINKGLANTAWKTIEEMAAIANESSEKPIIIDQIEGFICLILKSTMDSKQEVTLNFIKQVYNLMCFKILYLEQCNSRLALIEMWCDETLSAATTLPNSCFQNFLSFLHETVVPNEIDPSKKPAIARHAAMIHLHLGHLHSNKNLLLNQYTWIIPYLRPSCETQPNNIDLLCNFFKLMLDCNTPFHENPAIASEFWWVVFSILNREEFYEQDADLIQNTLSAQGNKSKGNKTTNQVETKALINLAVNCIRLNLPLRSCKILEKLLQLDLSQNTNSTLILETALICVKKLIDLKELTKGMNLLKQLETHPEGDVEGTLNAWLELISEFEKTNPWNVVDILINKAGALASNPKAHAHARSLLTNLRVNPKNPSTCLQGLQLLQHFPDNEASLWGKWLVSSSHSEDLKPITKAVDLLLNFVEPHKLLTSSPSERMRCWSEILKQLAEKPTDCIKYVLEKHNFTLSIINSFEDEAVRTEACKNLILAYLHMLQKPKSFTEENSPYIFTAIDNIHLPRPFLFNPVQSNDMDLSYVEACIEDEDPVIFMKAANILEQAIISPLNRGKTEKLLPLGLKAAQQLLRFKNHPDIELYTKILHIKAILGINVKEKIKLLPFLEAFIKHPSPLLHHDAFMLGFEIIHEYTPDKRSPMPAVYQSAAPIIKYLLIKTISDFHLDNVLKIINMLHQCKAKGFLSSNDFSMLWGQILLMHLNTAKKENSLELTSNALEFFILYNEMTIDNPEMQKRCLESAVERLLSLYLHFKNPSLFNGHFVIFCQYFLRFTESEINSYRDIQFDFNLPLSQENEDFDTTQMPSKELKFSYFSPALFMQNIETLCDKNAKPWLSLHTIGKKNKKVNDGFFNFMHALVKSLGLHKSDDPKVQTFIFGFTCTNIDMLNKLFFQKNTELAELLHHIAFRYIPDQPGIFQQHLRSIVHLFKTSQQIGIHKANPEKLFEIILFVDMNLCAHPAPPKGQQARSIHNVISLLCNTHSIPMLWRALYIIDRTQHFLLPDHSSVLNKVYEDLFKAVKRNAFHSVEGITLLEKLKQTLVDSIEKSVNVESYDLWVFQIQSFIKLVLDVQAQFSSKLACVEFIDTFLNSIKSKPLMKGRECIIIDILEMMWPLTNDPLNVPAAQIIFNQYTSLMQLNDHYPIFCKVIAISFNRWIFEIKLNKQAYSQILARELFKQALALDFFKQAPEDFKALWDILQDEKDGQTSLLTHGEITGYKDVKDMQDGTN